MAAILPVINCRKVAKLHEAPGAVGHTLSSDEFEQLDAALPAIAGSRYDAHQMTVLDSEK